jgi:regulator of nucleoside diphosphate kinase
MDIMSRNQLQVSARGIILWLLFGLNILVLIAALITGLYGIMALSIIISLTVLELYGRHSAARDHLNTTNHSQDAPLASARAQNSLLAAELKRAVTAKKDCLPAHCIFVDSSVTLLDIDTEHATELTIVLPDEADIQHNRLSVLTPLGMALVGFRTGEEVQWSSPTGLKRFRILDVINRSDRPGHTQTTALC